MQALVSIIFLNSFILRLMILKINLERTPHKKKEILLTPYAKEGLQLKNLDLSLKLQSKSKYKNINSKISQAQNMTILNLNKEAKAHILTKKKLKMQYKMRSIYFHIWIL